MAISPKYENFSFVGSKEDLFTKYKRKCTTQTAKQKRSKIITFGVVIFLLVGLVVGLSVGLHVQKSAEKSESTEGVAEALNNLERLEEGLVSAIDKNVTSTALETQTDVETVDANLRHPSPKEKRHILTKLSTILCSERLKCN